jgi:hypothetical protein
MEPELITRVLLARLPTICRTHRIRYLLRAASRLARVLERSSPHERNRAASRAFVRIRSVATGGEL